MGLEVPKSIMVKKINVTYYTDTPNYGGMEEHLFLLIKTLGKEKYNYQIILPDMPTLKVVYEKFEWLKAQQYEIEIVKEEIQNIYDIRGYMRLWSLLRKRKAVLHFYRTNIWSCHPAIFLSSLMGIRAVHSVLIAAGWHGNRWFSRSEVGNRWCVNLSYKTIVPTDEIKADFVKEYQVPSEKIVVIENGIELERFENVEVPSGFMDTLRQKYPKIDLEKVVILNIGRLVHQKGQDILIRAIERLRKSDPTVYEKIQVWIIGSGALESELQNQIIQSGLEEKVLLLGMRMDIEYFYKISSALISTSRIEGTPLVVLSALAAAKPVISTAVDGIKLVFGKNSNAAILVESENIDQISVAIKDFVEMTPEEKNKMGRNGYHIAKSRYSILSQVGEVEKIYADLSRQ
jgi:glycosyltransferase involved in cell wall biosynthesis